MRMHGAAKATLRAVVPDPAAAVRCFQSTASAIRVRARLMLHSYAAQAPPVPLLRQCHQEIQDGQNVLA